MPTDTMDPATAVTYGPFIQAAEAQYSSNPSVVNPATITNMPAGYTLNTRDFRCLGLSGMYRLSCSLSVLESVFVATLPVCGHGRDPRVAAGLARGSTVRGPGGRGGSSFLT